jgi:hypothetical protein
MLARVAKARCVCGCAIQLLCAPLVSSRRQLSKRRVTLDPKLTLPLQTGSQQRAVCVPRTPPNHKHTSLQPSATTPAKVKHACRAPRGTPCAAVAAPPPSYASLYV